MTRLTRTIEVDDVEREIIGFVDVRSGNLVISDASRLDRMWGRHDYEDLRCFRHAATGKTLRYGVDFPNFATPIPSEDGATMNALLATGDWERLENPRILGMSYAAASRATLSSDQAGQLLGNEGGWMPAGVAVDCPSGLVPVLLERRPDGSPLRLSIEFPRRIRMDTTEAEIDRMKVEEDLHLELAEAMVEDVIASANHGGRLPEGR